MKLFSFSVSTDGTAFTSFARSFWLAKALVRDMQTVSWQIDTKIGPIFVQAFHDELVKPISEKIGIVPDGFVRTRTGSKPIIVHAETQDEFKFDVMVLVLVDAPPKQVVVIANADNPHQHPVLSYKQDQNVEVIRRIKDGEKILVSVAGQIFWIKNEKGEIKFIDPSGLPIPIQETYNQVTFEEGKSLPPPPDLIYVPVVPADERGSTPRRKNWLQKLITRFVGWLSSSQE